MLKGRNGTGGVSPFEIAQSQGPMGLEKSPVQLHCPLESRYCFPRKSLPLVSQSKIEMELSYLGSPGDLFLVCLNCPIDLTTLKECRPEEAAKPGEIGIKLQGLLESLHSLIKMAYLIVAETQVHVKVGPFFPS